MASAITMADPAPIATQIKTGHPNGHDYNQIVNDPRRNVLYLTDSDGRCVLALGRDGAVSVVVAADAGFGIKWLAFDRWRGLLYCVSDEEVVHRLDGGWQPVAGSSRGYRDGPGATAQLGDIMNICVRRDGTLVVADARNNCVRTISPAGDVGTLASGYESWTGRTVPFSSPMSVCVDSRDNVLVRESLCVHMVAPCGQVTTLAGWPGLDGSCDGPGMDARFLDNGGLAADEHDTLYLVDGGSIRRIVLSGGGLLGALAAVPCLSGWPRDLLPLIVAFLPTTATVDTFLRCGNGGFGSAESSALIGIAVEQSLIVGSARPASAALVVCDAGAKAVYRIALPTPVPTATAS